ncbi:hypothetical protein Tco_1187808 [Tanacetum coccineum]
MDQCYIALIGQLDWTNPEGDRCPYDLSKSLPLQGSQGHFTIPVDFFFKHDLEYLKTGNTERKYTISITKTKAARNVELGICHWGPKRQLFYRSQIGKTSPHEVYSRMKILSMVRVSFDKQFGYGYLKEIVVRRADRQEYTFKEGDFPRLHLNDIEDMLVLHVQNKLFNILGDDIVDLVNALRMFTLSLVIKKRVEDVQLRVESYQKKLNVTKPQKEFPGISFKDPYTKSYDPKGVVYLNSRKCKRLMRADELYKFSDGTLQSVHKILHHRLLNFELGYNKDMPKRKLTDKDQHRT